MVKYKFSTPSDMQAVWWDNSSENRPSMSFIDGLRWVEIGVKSQLNYIDTFRASLVVNTFEYYYNRGYRMVLIKVERLSLTDNPLSPPTYYYVISTSNENNETITLNLSLDIWLSYSLDLFRQNIWVESMRSMYINSNIIEYSDDLLDSVPISYVGSEKQLALYRYPQFGMNSFLLGDVSIPNIQELGFKQSMFNMYYVFNKFQGLDYKNCHFAVPILGDIYTLGRKNGQRILLSNTNSFIDSLLSKPEYAANFIGIYYLPSTFNFSSYIVTIGNDNLSVSVVNLSDYLTYNGIDKAHNIKFDSIMPNLNIHGATFLNSLNNVSPLLFKYYKVNIMNLIPSSNWIYFLTQNGDIEIKAIYIYMQGISTFLIKNDILLPQESTARFPSSLPSGSDSYAQYIASVQNQINTGIQQSNDNMLWGIGKSLINGIVGGISSVANGIVNGNPVGAITGAVNNITNTGFGIGGQLISNSQYKQNVASKLGDIKRISGYSINPSTVSDASYINELSYGQPNRIYRQEYMTYIKPNDDSIKRLNNIIFLYGNCIPKNDFINSLLIRNKFNYILLADNWIGTNIDYIFSGKSLEIKSAIKNNLTGGFRVWETVPSLGVINEIK